MVKYQQNFNLLERSATAPEQGNNFNLIMRITVNLHVYRPAFKAYKGLSISFYVIFWFM